MVLFASIQSSWFGCARMIYWVSTILTCQIWFLCFLLIFFLFLMCFFFFTFLPAPEPTCFFYLYILPPLLHTLKCGQGCVGPQQGASKVSLYIIMQTISTFRLFFLSHFYYYYYYHFVRPVIEFFSSTVTFCAFSFWMSKITTNLNV